MSLRTVYTYRGEYGKAATVTERLREIANQIADPLIALVADRHIGISLITIGRLAEAQRYFERVIESSFLLAGNWLPIWREAADRALARAMLARALWLRGFLEKAHHEAQTSLDELHGDDPPLTLCRVLYFGICRIAPMTGDFETAETTISRMLTVATSLNARFWMTAGRFLEGKLMVERGEFAEGLAALREAFVTCDQTGWRMSYPEFTGSLAVAPVGLGRLIEADEAVNRAIARAGGREDGQQWYVPELLRIKGEVLLKQSSNQAVQAAESCFDQAAEMAREQGALFWELRAALSAARLRVSQKNRVGAAHVLQPVYNRFTEGFDTTDLKQARLLLDAL